ncbi:MAG: nucleotidyltransferase domain-containing protein [Nitrososphaeria archaeon]
MNDIKSIYIKSINEYVHEIRKELGQSLLSVCLFGSLARGDFTEESDIDLLVVAEGLPEDVGKRHSLFTRIRMRVLSSETAHNLREKGYSITFSEVFLTPDEVRRHPPILLDIVEDGIMLYDKDGFLATIINKMKERLKELGARRIKVGRGWYWLLKPDAKFGEEIVI